MTTPDALPLLRQCAYAAQPLRGSLAPEEAGVGRRHPWLSQGARMVAEHGVQLPSGALRQIIKIC